MTEEIKVENTNDEQDSVEKRSGIGRKIVVAAALVLLMIGAFFGLRWVVWRFHHATTNAAFVKADMADVAPEVPGKILSIEVREGQKIRRGDLLLKIDPAQNRRRVGEAEAGLASAQAALNRSRRDLERVQQEIPAAIRAAESALEAARAGIAGARSHLDHLEKQHERFASLLEQRAISRSKFEEVETAWIAARSALEAAQAGVRLREADLERARAARARIPAAKAGVQQAEAAEARAVAALKLARLALSRCELRAPIDGIVARVLADAGDFATPGRPVVGLYDPASLYIEARFEETKLRYLHRGKKVELKIDALPGKRIPGHITRMAPASSAEFALIPRDITAGEFTKVTQRMPIRIAPESDLELLIPGLSVEVSVSKKNS